MFSKLRRFIAPPVIEQRSIQLAQHTICYTLKRSSKRRSIGLRIDDKGLTVSMPLRASEKWLHSVLQDKASWVVDKLTGWEARKIAIPQWLDGQQIRLLGEPVTLCVVRHLFASSVQLSDKKLCVYLAEHEPDSAIEAQVTRWYQQQAEAFFQQRVAHFAEAMQVAPRQIKLSSARTQWGSCTTRGTVRLNWHLIKLSPRLIDYVVVHELAHLREMNHSAAFWRVVEAACPDYLQRRKELKAQPIQHIPSPMQA